MHYTYTNKGARRVKAINTGNEKTRLSVIYTASANGDKLPVYALIPRVTPIPVSFSQKNHVRIKFFSINQEFYIC